MTFRDKYSVVEIKAAHDICVDTMEPYICGLIALSLFKSSDK